MRQNPKWILLSEVRSAEAVMAVRNSISSGHYILSTIHADKASSIPNRMYSLLETNQDINQFLKSIYRYIQIGVYIRGYQDKATHRFIREIAEVTEFYVTEDNQAVYNTIYKKTTLGHVVRKKPSKYLIDYLDAQGVSLPENIIQESEINTVQNINRVQNQNVNNIPAQSIQSINPNVQIQNPNNMQSHPTINSSNITMQNVINPITNTETQQ